MDYKSIIDDIVWWIPFKKLRNSLRNYMNILIENKIYSLINDNNIWEIVQTFYYKKLGYDEIRPIGYYESPYPPKEELIEGYNSIKNGTSFMFNMNAINLNDGKQLDFYKQISDFFITYNPPKNKTDGFRYYYNNPAFIYTCGIYLHAIINYIKPKNIIEIGSGHSTALILDTIDKFFNNNINLLCIEPYPERLKSLLKKTDNIKIIETKQQYVPLETFSILEENDILFIDSSHVCRAFGDINRQFFEILPNLKKGVIIHLHDIAYPFEYPEEWTLNGWAFTESYMLRAFLEYNDTFEILLFPSYMQNKYPDIIKLTNGSIYLRKIK